MPEVDPEDDTIWRWVIHHFRYDPERNERRHVVVAAYDNADEFETELERYQQQVGAGADEGGGEQVSGTTFHPGYQAEHDLARMALRAIRHGVNATVRAGLMQQPPAKQRVNISFGWAIRSGPPLSFPSPESGDHEAEDR